MVGVLRVRIFVPVFLIGAGALFGACGSSLPGVVKVGASNSPSTTLSTSTSTSTTVTGASTPVTGPPGVSVPTTIVTYPTPYAPSYDTIDSLVDDSDYVVVASIGSAIAGGYPLSIQSVLSFTAPKTPLSITTGEFNAADLQVGGTYVFFYGIDTIDNSNCIVGGARGVLGYDPTTQTVTRLDQSVASQIPDSESFAQLQNAVAVEENNLSAEPISNGPPVCASSATGL